MRSVHRFYLLDGYRGIAALSVLIMHMLIVVGYPVIRCGYLAVDLFFAMSGFVIAHAYEQKLLEGMSAATFVRLRLQRLYPLIALAAVIGAMVHISDFDGITLGSLFIRALLLIPTPMEDSSPAAWLITLNFVGWSLLFEIIVNLAYGLIARRLTNRLLGAIIAVSCMVLVLEFLGHGWMNIGSKAADGASGLVRAAFGFFMGIAIFRAHDAGRLSWVKVHPAVGIALLSAIMIWPITVEGLRVSGLASVLVIFPILIAGGANARIGTFGRKVCAHLGAISYPLYILQSGPHDLAVKIMGAAHPGLLSALGIAAAMAFAAALLAYAGMKLIDEPIQRWIKGSGQRGIAATARHQSCHPCALVTPSAQASASSSAV